MKQLEHRSIRAFKPDPVNNEIFNKIMHIAQRTATSMGMQRSSIIRITDQTIKDAMADIGGQSYIADAPVLLIMIVDLYRNMKVCDEKGIDGSEMVNTDSFFQGFTDCILTAQNITTAYEDMGLGGVFLGSILNDTKKIIELLKLPKYTFPALGLAFGYPDQTPSLKPRMPMELRLFENSYKTFDNYLERLSEYDAEMKKYYDLRNTEKPLPAFTDQVLNTIVPFERKRTLLIENAKSQGFIL